MRSIFLALIAAVSVSLVTSGTPALAAEPQPKVLIFGLDGTRPGALRAADTPNIDQLIAHGASSFTTQILGARFTKNDTISGPGWSSNLTGVWADKHGVMDNTFEGRNFDEYPHFFHYLEEAQPESFTVSIASWSPINKYIVSEADIVHTEPTGEGTDEEPLAGVKQADVGSTEKAVEILKTTDPTAMFLYFHQIDSAGHTFGFHRSVPEYVVAIERVDRHIGEVLEALRNRETYNEEDWLILVTTDHGGKGRGHSNGQKVPSIRTTFLIVSGPSAKQGRIKRQTYTVDVATTALAHLGVEIEPEWKLDGRVVGLGEAGE